jgi:hypothetical protein
MSRLETSARAVLILMLHGKATLFDWNAQRTLAGWAVRTASVADHSQGEPWRLTSVLVSVDGRWPGFMVEVTCGARRRDWRLSPRRRKRL